MWEKIKAVLIAVLAVTSGVTAKIGDYMFSETFLEKQHYKNMCEYLQQREIVPYRNAGTEHYDYYVNCIATLKASDMGVECGFYPTKIWHQADYESMTPDNFRECMYKETEKVLGFYSTVEGHKERFFDAIEFVIKDYEKHYAVWQKFQSEE